MRRLGLAIPLLAAASVAACANYGFGMAPNMIDAGYTHSAGPASTLTAPPTIDVNTIVPSEQVSLPPAQQRSATMTYQPPVKQNDQTKQFKANSDFGSATQFTLVGASATVGLKVSKPQLVPNTSDNRAGMPELGVVTAGNTGKAANRGFWWEVTITNTTAATIDISTFTYRATAGAIACKDVTGQDTAGHNFAGPMDMNKFYAGEPPSSVSAGDSVTFLVATACQAVKGSPLTLRVFSGDKDEKARIYNAKLP